MIWATIVLLVRFSFPKPSWSWIQPLKLKVPKLDKREEAENCSLYANKLPYSLSISLSLSSVQWLLLLLFSSRARIYTLQALQCIVVVVILLLLLQLESISTIISPKHLSGPKCTTLRALYATLSTKRFHHAQLQLPPTSV